MRKIGCPNFIFGHSRKKILEETKNPSIHFILSYFIFSIFMDRIAILFLIGLGAGVLVPLTESAYESTQLLEEPLTVIQQVFVGSTFLWHIGISILILISLPTAIFKRLSNHLSEKRYVPIPLMTGISFGFTFMGTLGLVASSLQ
jgi:hypothetical protein